MTAIQSFTLREYGARHSHAHNPNSGWHTAIRDDNQEPGPVRVLVKDGKAVTAEGRAILKRGKQQQ